MRSSAVPTIKSTRAPTKVCRQSMEFLVGFFVGFFCLAISLTFFPLSDYIIPRKYVVVKRFEKINMKILSCPLWWTALFVDIWDKRHWRAGDEKRAQQPFMTVERGGNCAGKSSRMITMNAKYARHTTNTGGRLSFTTCFIWTSIRSTA